MAVRNLAIAVSACIILMMLAPRTYGQSLEPKQVLLLADTVAATYRAIGNELRNRANPNLTYEQVKSDEQLESEIRAQFSELLQKMTTPEFRGPLVISVSSDELENVVRETFLTAESFNLNTCSRRIDQLLVDTIYHKKTR